MFKQLLTFALAGILVLETPATAYAAGQSMNVAGQIVGGGISL